MSWVIKITLSMLEQIRVDLRRPHDFAGERVGFLFSRVGNQNGDELIVLPANYAPVPDEHYIDDPKVGARINSAAIRSAMQSALTDGVGVFHVHMHEHLGHPRFSRVDLDNYPSLIAAFRNVAPSIAHGAVLLSNSSCDALVWLPGTERPIRGGRVVVTGRPTEFLDGDAVYA